MVRLAAESGAVYNPEAEIMPKVAFPPATPLTCHVNEGLVLPLMLAANCCDPPAAMLADAGVMEIEGRGGGGDPLAPFPHPMSTLVRSNANDNPKVVSHIQPSPERP